MGVPHSSPFPQTPLPFVNLPPVETICKLDESDERTERTLKHLLRLNHHSHAVIFHNLTFHNHLPHLLGSAYLFGASDRHLTTTYDKETTGLEPWTHSPNEIDESDWEKYLGDAKYQRAYLDFFEDEMVREKYDWKKVLREYLLEKGENPLINGLIGGLGHPLIHVGYAIELDNREVAMEALAMAASSYNDLHKFIDKEPEPLPPNATKSVLEILHRIAGDDRLASLFPAGPGEGSIPDIFSAPNYEIIQEYFNQLDLQDPTDIMRQLAHIPTLLLCATHSPASKPEFDFFLVHTLTTSYAVRVLLPTLPPKHHINLLRQHYLFIIVDYIAQKRPSIHPELITEYKLEPGKDTWEYVTKLAIDDANKRSADPHYVKALRALRDFADVYVDEDEFYLRAAVKFAREFTGWVGFHDREVHLHVRD